MTETEFTIENGINYITSSTIIRKSREEVWEVLKFPGLIQEFHPLIKKSYIIGVKENGEGAKRCCELLPMGQMIEEVREWKEMECYTTEVVGGKILPPYEFMKGKITLKDVSGFTHVSFTFTYKLKSQLMDRLFVRSNFKNAPKKYVGGLKEYMESH